MKSLVKHKKKFEWSYLIIVLLTISGMASFGLTDNEDGLGFSLFGGISLMVLNTVLYVLSFYKKSLNIGFLLLATSFIFLFLSKDFAVFIFIAQQFIGWVLIQYSLNTKTNTWHFYISLIVLLIAVFVMALNHVAVSSQRQNQRLKK